MKAVVAREGARARAASECCSIELALALKYSNLSNRIESNRDHSFIHLLMQSLIHSLMRWLSIDIVMV